MVDKACVVAAFEHHPDVMSCTIDEQGVAKIQLQPGAAIRANALLAYIETQLGAKQLITPITFDA